MGLSIQRKNTIVVSLSDMHSGGSTALFPPYFMQFKHGNHTPTDFQKMLFKHYEKSISAVKEARKGKRLIVVHNGDAIDGVHHSSLEIVTKLKTEQIQIHIELMDMLLKEAGFNKKRGDRLYYTVGTECHTNDNEDIIGKDLGAEMNGDLYAFDNLKLSLNDREIWFTHHGTSAGKGANKGNAQRNWLKNVFFDSLEEHIYPPDMIVSSHTYVANYGSYIGRIKDRWHTLRGIITPSWQMKTRFARRVAALSKNEVGLWYFEITDKGDLLDPVPCLKDTATKDPIML